MKKYVIGMLVLVIGFALAEEFPYIPGTTCNIPGTTPIELDQTELKPFVSHEPVWKGLAQMSQEERENSEIELILEQNATDEALHMAYRIENVWNSGEFENALALFPELAELTDINEMAIGNAWRTPIPTQEQPDWGADVRIGNRDSVYICVFDRHNTTGNLFTIILLNGDGNTARWAVNFSTDGGQTWSETYDWWANYDLNSLDAVVVADHCYVGFGRGSSQDQGFLYRFRVTDGTQENFPNGSSYIIVFTTTSPDLIAEVSLWANHDQFDNRIYYSAIISNGQVRALWDDPDATSWTEYTTNITNAERGLDAGWNQDNAARYHWLSYLSYNDSLHIHSVEAGTWSQRLQYAVGTPTDYTSVGAYRDTIIVFFDYRGAGVYIRYLVTYDAGGTWYYGTVDDTTTTQESPDVTARRGGGTGVVYRFYASPRELRYAWRNYSGGWSTPVRTTEYAPYYNKPSIEYLDGGVHGVVYLSWTSPQYHAVYFTRSDWTGIVENKSKDLTSHLVSLAPNPSRGSSTRLFFVVTNQGNVNISVYDAAGRIVKTLVNESKPAGDYSITMNNDNLASGIYFVRVETPDGVNTKPMTIIR